MIDGQSDPIFGPQVNLGPIKKLQEKIARRMVAFLGSDQSNFSWTEDSTMQQFEGKNEKSFDFSSFIMTLV